MRLITDLKTFLLFPVHPVEFLAHHRNIQYSYRYHFDKSYFIRMPNLQSIFEFSCNKYNHFIYLPKNGQSLVYEKVQRNEKVSKDFFW